MFDIIKVDLEDKSSLEKIKSIYESSFPENERRDFDEALNLIANQQFTFSSIVFDKETVGLLFTWDLNTFSYIEYFAIGEAYRSSGIGSYILGKFINNQEKQIILEVELPTDIISLKRIKFYEKFGFVLCKEDYIQPPYSDNKDAVPMIIMSRPEIMSLDEFNEIRNELYKNVYKWFKGTNL